MCNYAKWLVFLALIFANVFKILAQQPSDSIPYALSFEDALAKTSENNQTIRQSEALLEQKKYEMKAVVGSGTCQPKTTAPQKSDKENW